MASDSENKSTADRKAIHGALAVARKKDMFISFVEKGQARKTGKFLTTLAAPGTVDPVTSNPIANNLWLSTPKQRGSSWYAWAIQEMPEKIHGREIVGFALNESKLCKINTVKRLIAFDAKYGEGSKVHSIDWKRVGADFSGVMFVPYMYEALVAKISPASRMEVYDKYGWYRNLDADTVIVWDKTAVRRHARLL